MVINYDMPSCAEDYVHRIGRTGRAGASGTAYSFFTSANAKLARQLEKVLEEAGQPVPPELRNYSATSRGGGTGECPTLPAANAWGNKCCSWQLLSCLHVRLRCLRSTAVLPHHSKI